MNGGQSKTVPRGRSTRGAIVSLKHIVAVLLVGACAQLAYANGVIRDPLGARVAGRGGANVAYADSGMILHDNPAGMVHLPAQHFTEFGVDLLFTEILYTDPTSPRETNDSDPIPLGNVSIVRRTGDDNFAYGIGLFSPGGFSTDYFMTGPIPFGPQKYKSFSSLTRILPGVAYSIDDKLSIGATLGVAVSHTELEGPYFLQTGALAGTPLLMDLQATGAALSWSVGVQYQASDRTAVGLSYQSENRFHLDGNTRTNIPGLGQSRFDTTVDMTWPRTATLGVRHSVTPYHVLGIDVAWFNWSTAFDHVGLHMTNPNNPVFGAAVGSQLTEQFPLTWHDSLSVRLGMERYFSSNTVARWGYSYMENPIPNETLTPYVPSTLQHSVGFGLGWKMRGYETDLAYQFFFSDTRRVGTSSLIGGDFDNSSVRTQVHMLYLGWTKHF